jgi:hypothetical protein
LLFYAGVIFPKRQLLLHCNLKINPV